MIDAIKKYWYIFFRHTRKNFKLPYYVDCLAALWCPKWISTIQYRYYNSKYDKLTPEKKAYIDDRVGYYCKLSTPDKLNEDALTIGSFRYDDRKTSLDVHVKTVYFFDVYKFLRFFPKHYKWNYHPGDIAYICPTPAIAKSRKIAPNGEDRNNTLLNINSIRHFMWVTDPYEWEEKEGMVLFRGDAREKPRRQQFIDMWKDNPHCDLMNTSKMSIYDHLRYRYIMALEGNDVASNLKWVMSSGSIAVMPKPTCETWFMEGRLKPDYHYILIKDDYSDLMEKIEYYEQHPEEAKEIVRHANEYTKQFKDKITENIISIKVMEKYFRMTKQTD